MRWNFNCKDDFILNKHFNKYKYIHYTHKIILIVEIILN